MWFILLRATCNTSRRKHGPKRRVTVAEGHDRSTLALSHFSPIRQVVLVLPAAQNPKTHTQGRLNCCNLRMSGRPCKEAKTRLALVKRNMRRDSSSPFTSSWVPEISLLYVDTTFAFVTLTLPGPCPGELQNRTNSYSFGKHQKTCKISSIRRAR